MSADTEQTVPDEIEWPPTLRAEVEGTPPRRAWYLTIGPAYLTIFIFGPFFDPLWRHDVAAESLPTMAATAVVAAVLCFALFYYPAAIWGFRTGRRLGVVAGSTFGTTGSDWLTGPMLAAAEIVWYAVAIDFAVQSTLLGLITCGLLAPDVLAYWPVGGTLLRGPTFLCAALFWIFITGMASLLRLTSVIGALMKVYAPVAAVLLTVAAIGMLPGVSAFLGGEPLAGKAVPPYPPRLSALPVFTGFFALVGLLSVDWGAASARRRDVVIGGLAGIVGGGGWSALMSLLVVAGAVGRLHASHPVDIATATTTPVLSFRWAIAHGMGGAPAATILILLGLAALAPACFSSFVFIRKLFARWPRVRRIDWTWIGCGAGFILVATGWAGRLEAVDHVMGIIFAPAVGAMAGEWITRRGEWPGVRRGLHLPGVAAWALGVVMRLVLDVIAERGALPMPTLLASPVAGFLVAGLAYAAMAGVGLERPAVPVETYPAGSGEVPAMAAGAADAAGVPASATSSQG